MTVGSAAAITRVATASIDAGSAYSDAEGARWGRGRGYICGPGRTVDHAGRVGKHRCLEPVINAFTKANGERNVYRSRCRKCDECMAHKRAIRIARTMHMCRVTARTWFDTRTFGWTDILQHYADARYRGRQDQRWRWDDLQLREQFGDVHRRAPDFDPEGETFVEGNRQAWFDREAQRQKANFHKRLRKLGAAFMQSTNTELHESELKHFHSFIHETTPRPITFLQMVAATFIMPRGYRRPARRHEMVPVPPGHYGPPAIHWLEKHGEYWRRVVSELYAGWREWQSLRDMPGEAARKRRLRLPVQVTRIPQAGTRVIVDNRRKRRKGGKAIAYATKGASYSTKSGGRWSASPGYAPRQRAGAGHRAETGGAASGSSCPPAHTSIPEWCHGAASKQELGHFAPRSEPPRPPATGPPSDCWTKLALTLSQGPELVPKFVTPARKMTHVYTPEIPSGGETRGEREIEQTARHQGPEIPAQPAKDWLGLHQSIHPRLPRDGSAGCG